MTIKKMKNEQILERAHIMKDKNDALAEQVIDYIIDMVKDYCKNNPKISKKMCGGILICGGIIMVASTY